MIVKWFKKKYPTSYEVFMKKREKFVLAVVLLSALNSGFWGWYQFDFVAWIFHSNTSWSARVMYAFPGFCSLFYLYCQVEKVKMLQRSGKDMLN
jgi:uncharacterized membrane protein YuzA (DUF378 family)